MATSSENTCVFVMNRAMISDMSGMSMQYCSFGRRDESMDRMNSGVSRYKYIFFEMCKWFRVNIMRSASRPYTSVTCSRCSSELSRMYSNILCSPSPGSLLDDSTYVGDPVSENSLFVLTKLLNRPHPNVSSFKTTKQFLVKRLLVTKMN